MSCGPSGTPDRWKRNGAREAAGSRSPTWVLHVAADADEVNHHLAELRAAGMLGTAEVDGRTDVYFPRQVVDLDLAGTWEAIPDRDWHTQWREGLTPVTAGRWTITPPWHATGATGEVVIDPGQAFGTGHHETTVWCLRALDDVAVEGRRVLDLGTGSGVLAIAAARRGARVVAVDIDPLAVEATVVNAQRNGTRIDVRLGNVGAVVGERFDVVVANLDSATLKRLAVALAALLVGNGTLIASGIGNENIAAVARAMRDAGLQVATTGGAEWSLLLAHHPRAARR
jgi:ribosomal protein L11 methyltransferase